MKLICTVFQFKVLITYHLYTFLLLELIMIEYIKYQRKNEASRKIFGNFLMASWKLFENCLMASEKLPGGLSQRRHAQRAKQPRPLAPDVRLVEVDGEAVQELVRSLVEAPPRQSSEVAFVSEGGEQ